MKQDFKDDYEPTQIKILNFTIAITRDSGASMDTAIGKFYCENSTEEYIQGKKRIQPKRIQTQK